MQSRILFTSLLFVFLALGASASSGAPETGGIDDRYTLCASHPGIHRYCQEAGEAYRKRGDYQGADSLIQKALDEAELTYDPRVILSVLCEYFSLIELQNLDPDRTREHAARMEELIRDVDDAFTRWRASAKLSEFYLTLTVPDRAYQFAERAMDIAQEMDDDSLRVLSLLAIAESLYALEDPIEAFKKYLEAMNLAEDMHDVDLHILCYVRLSTFFARSGMPDMAKDYTLLRIQVIDTEKPIDSTAYMRAKCDLQHYMLLGENKVIDQELRDLISFSQRHHDTYLRRKTLAIYRTYYIDNDMFGDLHRLYAREYPEELEWLRENETVIYYRVSAILAEVEQDTLSALACYAMADSLSLAELNPVGVSRFYLRYGEFLERMGWFSGAITRYRQSYEWAEKGNYPSFSLLAADQLQHIYQLTGNTDSALYFALQGRSLMEKLAELNNSGVILRDDMKNTYARDQKHREDEKMRKDRRHQIQYIGIFIFIIIAFVVLIFAGSYRVSETFIRVKNFFLFIMLFEFVIMLADRWIHHSTDGEPLLMLGLKILLIAILYPLHHWVEKRAIQLLVNRTIIRMRSFSFRTLREQALSTIKEIWGPE